MEEREYNGVVYVRSGPGQPWVRRGPAQGVVLPAAPAQQYEAPKAAADARKAAAEATVKEAEAPFAGQVAAAEAAVKGAAAQDTQLDIARKQRAEALKELRSGFQTDNILQVIRRARKTAQDEGGTGWAALMSGIPNTTARKLKGDLDTIFGNLSFERLQQMRDESPTGGAVGNASDRDISLLGSTVASLDQAVDLPTFLERLDQVERNFIGMQVAAAGYDPRGPEAREIFKREFGYTGVFEGELPQDQASLADPNATQTAVDIPQEYQVAHLRYLRDNWGNIDPRDYSAFRTGLDNQFDLEPNPSAYAAAVPGFNDAARQGATPEQLGAVPAPPRELGLFEQGINRAAQSPGGSFVANLGNAAFAGLPMAVSGNQERLELLRDAQPEGAFLGEIGGNIAGTALTGGLAGRAGMNLLARPFASELAYGTTYGATQDENPIRGAGMGAAGSILGSYAGQKFGQAFPDVVAPDVMRNMEAQIPTIDDLKSLAGQQYAAVEAAGAVAGPGQTTRLSRQLDTVLRDEGRITPQNALIDENTPITKAMKLVKDFAGQPMTPQQAGAVRNILSEGRAVGTPNERRIAGKLVEKFDQWAEPTLPGIEVPRATAQRYLQGQQIADRVNIGNIRGQRAKGNDIGDSLRTQFGQLDEAVERGDAYFDAPTREAIALAARGDGLTNALRSLGKFGLGNPLTAGGVGVGGTAAFLGGVDPLYAGIALTTGALGTASRRLAEQRTQRAAQDALLTALSNDEQRALMQAAAQQAATRGGRIGGGLFGSTAGMTNREQRPLPR